MSRRDRHRLEDILEAAPAIASHLGRGALDDGLVFDAVRVRLIEIGEAVKTISPELLAHRYFDTAHAIVRTTVQDDLPPLVAAVERLLAAVDSDPEQ